jgi:alpha-tubulin suppressor-like RCC1 family protein
MNRLWVWWVARRAWRTTVGVLAILAGSFVVTFDQPASAVDLPSVSAGGLHTCTLSSGGAVKCWGNNSSGQLGDGTETTRLSPPTSSVLVGATQITTGNWNTCAILADATVDCWGNKNDGLFDTDAGSTHVLVPTPVPGLSGVTQISAGGSHVCALLYGGVVDCFGSNSVGQLGVGTADNNWHPPTRVSGLTGVTQISAGWAHTCARLVDATVKCWGTDTAGALGDGHDGISQPSIVSVRGVGGGAVRLGGKPPHLRAPRGQNRCVLGVRQLRATW